jgi:hypothetical protein
VTESLVRRDQGGRWQKGSSGNPEGRRAELAVREVVQLARTATAEAVETLREIAADKSAPAVARVRACEALLSRGWGSPSDEVSLEMADRPEPSPADLLINFRWDMSMGADEPPELVAEPADYHELPGT